MAQKASWGPKTFETTPRSIRPFKGFTTSVTLKEDSENDTSGTPPTNTRGRELQPLNFETFCVRAAGVDPMTEFNSWCSLVGQSHPFYLGGVKLGPAESFKLKSVGVAETEHAEDGTVICMKISLAFVEQSEGKTSKLDSTGDGTKVGTNDGKTARSDTAAEMGIGTGRAERFVDERRKALAAEADKKKKEETVAEMTQLVNKRWDALEKQADWNDLNLWEQAFIFADDLLS